MSEMNSQSHVVVIGSSAGGVDALTYFVSTLPADFPAPILIAQHLDPARPSHLSAILSHHSTLPVRAVTDHASLEPGTVFVVPSNQHVEFNDHDMSLVGDGSIRPTPSIDRLLRSAARVHGENLIAVILTGIGSDGAAGAREVKDAGGTVVIQNPATAEFPSMPQSLAPTLVDFVVDLEDLASVLARIVSVLPDDLTPVVGKEITLESFLSHVQTQCSVDFSQYKTPTILRRLQRRIIATGSDDLGSYSDYLQQHPEEYQQLVNSFLIKVTDFFRDPELFDYLRTTVLPEVIEEARERGQPIRLWSAGCATGEEAYSLAILVSELLGNDLDNTGVRIFATDLDAAAVTFARRGVYNTAALSSVPEELVNRYFIEYAGEYEINKRIRGMVIFGQHDLGQRSPFPRIDLILCRNVLIYFTSELQRRALQLFAFSLRSDGLLVLGKSESTNPMRQFFATEQSQLKVFRRQGEPVVIPSGRLDASLPSSRTSTPATTTWRHASSFELLRAQREAQNARVTVERTETLLSSLPAGVIMVDRNYDIQMINNSARRYLGIHGTAIDSDLLHLTRTVPLEPLREVIDRSFRERRVVRVDSPFRIEHPDGNQMYVDVACTPHGSEQAEDGNIHVIVLLTDVTTPERERVRAEEERRRVEAEVEHTSTRWRQLLNANEDLLEANRELTRTNEALRGANEQLRVSNEEAQAVSEEIETLNEELQATNEELETLNEELQATVEELNVSNDDMLHRTEELQELTVKLEDERLRGDDERAQVQAILASMSDAVLAVACNGTVILKNDACEQMFGEDLRLLRPENEDGHLLPDDMHPVRRAASGEQFNMQFTLVGPEGSRSWFDASAQSIRRTDGVTGSVVVIRDITERSLRRLQEEFMSMASHELRTPLTALRGYLEMLQNQLPDGDERLKRYATVTVGLVKRMATLVDDLLEVGRLQTGKFHLTPEPVDLSDLLRQTVELAQPLAAGKKVVLQQTSDRVMVNADTMRLQQTFLNLLSNAFNYSPHADRVAVRQRVEGEYAVVEVQDYGVGISEQDLEQVFARFYQGDRSNIAVGRGLGLGLYLADEIVRAHGGSVEVESALGEGSTFTVRLPLLDADPGSQAA